MKFTNNVGNVIGISKTTCVAITGCLIATADVGKEITDGDKLEIFPLSVEAKIDTRWVHMREDTPIMVKELSNGDHVESLEYMTLRT
jgi:hypothetical protein